MYNVEKQPKKFWGFCYGTSVSADSPKASPTHSAT